MDSPFGGLLCCLTVVSMRIRPFQQSDLPTLKMITVEAFDGVSIDQGIERVHGIIAGHDWKWRKARHLDDDLRPRISWSWPHCADRAGVAGCSNRPVIIFVCEE